MSEEQNQEEKSPIGDVDAIKKAVKDMTGGKVKIEIEGDQFVMTCGAKKNKRTESGNINQHPNTIATAARKMLG